jgi:hypothetical protein
LENDVADGWMNLVEKAPVEDVWAWLQENKRPKNVVLKIFRGFGGWNFVFGAKRGRGLV